MAIRELNGPQLSDIKKLYALSGNNCAFPKCANRIVLDTVNVGEVCHIKAASPNGPRYDPSQVPSQRHSYENLILLCANHHKVVDDDTDSYTVERLRRMKADHESRSTPTSDREAELAARALLVQSVSTQNQSGGVAAHTIHVGTIHVGSAESAVEAGPDWQIRELFFHIKPDILDTSEQDEFDATCQIIEDQFSTGQLLCWGREIDGSRRLPLALIPAAHWQHLKLIPWLLDTEEDGGGVLQADRRKNSSPVPQYTDLRVNRAQALRRWPKTDGAAKRNGDPETEFASTGGTASISQDAKEILMAAAASKGGTILIALHMAGTTIQANRKTFGESDNRRSIARWEAAVDELADRDYVRDISGRGQVFQVTDAGYRLIEAAT